jgi:hypothetical protein
LISVCSCVLFAVIVGVSIVFLVASSYVIFGLPSVFCGAAGFFSLVPVYLQYEYLLLFGMKKLLSVWFPGRFCSLYN